MAVQSLGQKNARARNNLRRLTMELPDVRYLVCSSWPTLSLLLKRPQSLSDFL
jgi:hypothetical protein